ncbi:OmpA/MotB domain protein [Arcobacter nitrofigilis DSM 7299]|uniref:OmpA/MotB domain protein n=1 Tax=Arcobacter nitrofigilis (strain ATCC 33309 / DSM 7299 / CCUG 15893 / LMG 7604 / NCTC 12251 / CI) TaxID=572480 RepID=D5V3Q8_ARCNC|nr:OmpA family protein [Arcobacter nitrofigilis]ADG91769.1 OmpA/MotB domain protein [Arcobacter nitrofigilis DSM 7299]
MSILKQIIFLSFLLVAIMVACVYLYINQDKFGTTTFYTPSISQKIIIPEKTVPIQEEIVEGPSEKVVPPIIEDQKDDAVIDENTDEDQKKIDDIEKPDIENADIIVDDKKEVDNTKKVVIPEDKKIEELSHKIQPKNIQDDTIESKMDKNKKTQDEINAVISKDHIFFKRLGTDITDESYKVVEQIAKILKNNPSVKIEIGGHTDAKGEADVNQWISLQRAKSVKKELEKLGIAEDRITAVGYGESQPLVPNDKNGYSSENRRVEFKIIEE